jgi:hypothetical protein
MHEEEGMNKNSVVILQHYMLRNDIITCNNRAAHVEVLICADKIVPIRRVV